MKTITIQYNDTMDGFIALYLPVKVIFLRKVFFLCDYQYNLRVLPINKLVQN